MKRVAVLGSTGSIGTQILQVAEAHPERLQIRALSAGRNQSLLIQQAKQFRPELVSVADAGDAERVRSALSGAGVQVVSGAQGLLEVATSDVDLVAGALVGSLGLEPVLAALAAGRDVALANKEVLVMAGALVLREAERSGGRILPLDSEHVAVHQSLAGHPREALARILLTASGGPFRRSSEAELAQVTREQALAHPNWEMGPKITIDSATLMNKGLEVIEARWLFDLLPEQIGVVIHPESIIHSLVEYVDGSWLAQLGLPDMRIPIAYALGMPERLPLPELKPLDLVEIGALHFEAPNAERFPALGLALEANRIGGTAPAVLNAANEVAVGAFLENRIPFRGIATSVAEVLNQAEFGSGLDLDEIRDADRRGREAACTFIEASKWN